MPNHDGVYFEALNLGFDAHLTILYKGEMTPIEFDKIKELFEEHKLIKRHEAYRRNLALFGPRKDIPVIKVDISPYLAGMHWSLVDLVGSGSEFDWDPHITLDYEAFIITIPTIIRLATPYIVFEGKKYYV
jgi:hypothetical protein